MAEKIVNVNPITKWKRILVYLADLFLTFIIGFVFVNTLVLPVGQKIIGYESRSNEIQECTNKRIDILYENNLLFYNENEKYDFDKNIIYTFDLYLKNYVMEENTNEVFKNYYVNKINNKERFLELYNILDKDYGYFEIVENVVLKDEYKTMFAPYFTPGDVLSTDGQEKLDTLKERIFTQLYSEMLTSIETNDLTYNDLSYKAVLDRENYQINFISYFFSVGSLIGYVMSLVLCFILIPCFFSNRRTLGMIFLRVQSIDYYSLKEKTRKSLLLGSILSIPQNAPLIFLLPAISIGFNKTFALPLLFPISIVGLLYAIVSLIFLLINEYNKDLSDIASSTVVISNDDYDKIVYERSVKNGKQPN